MVVSNATASVRADTDGSKSVLLRTRDSYLNDLLTDDQYWLYSKIVTHLLEYPLMINNELVNIIRLKLNVHVCRDSANKTQNSEISEKGLSQMTF